MRKEIQQLSKIFITFILIYLLFVLVYRKKIESILIDREIYLLELKKKQMERQNRSLMSEYAKRKVQNQESILYYWKIYRSLPLDEDIEIIELNITD